jgi:hypothetical protein
MLNAKAELGILAACLGITLWAPSAKPAIVRTASGRTWSGDTSFGQGALAIGGTNVVLNEVAWIDFLARPAPPSAPPSPASTTNPIVPPPSQPRPRVTVTLLPTSESQPEPWRYTTTRPPDNWARPEFAQTSWPRAVGAFGVPDAPKTTVRTPWNTTDIWMRRKFSLDALPAEPRLRIAHAEDAEVFLNGRELARFQGKSDGYVERVLDKAAAQAFLVGANVVAVHCRHGAGDQKIDLGLLDTRADGEPAPPGPKPPKAMQPHGLRAEYFNAPDLRGPVVERCDPQLDFDWGTGSPMPTIRTPDFGVRWTGAIEVPANATYTFTLAINGSARLWLGDMPVIEAWTNRAHCISSRPLLLKAGARYALRLEYVKSGGLSEIKLFWSTPIQPPGVVPSSWLIPAGTPRAAGGLAQPELVAEKDPATGLERKPDVASHDWLTPGVLLADGSFIARQVYFADATKIRFSDNPQDLSLPLDRVARLIFQPTSDRALAAVSPGRPGLLMRQDNAFLEGELKSVSLGRVKISSVLFGLKEYFLGEVAVVVLQDHRPAPRQFEIQTRDKWTIRADSFRIEPGGLVLEQPGLSGTKIPSWSLSQIRRFQR